MNKDIQAYFNKIGLRKASNVETEIRKVFGSKADDLIGEYNRIFDDRDADHNQLTFNEENVSRQKDVVDFTHSSLKMSMLFAGAYDTDVYEKCVEFFLANKRSFGKEILDFGCGNGIVTCFIAKMLPKSHVTGIDESVNAIHSANEIKKRLKLNNVDFVVSDDYKQEPVDTLISVRTFHENTPQLPTNCAYYPYSRVLQDHVSAYQPFISHLTNHIKQGGSLYCFERGNHFEFPAIAIALEKAGMTVDLSSYKPKRCEEAHDYSILFTLSARKESKPRDIEKLIERTICKEIPYGYSGIYAQKMLETVAGDVIDAFLTVDKAHTICGYHGQFVYVPDPTKFVLYQQNKEDMKLQIFDVNEDTEEARQLFAEIRAQEANKGFTLINMYTKSGVETWIDEYLMQKKDNI